MATPFVRTWARLSIPVGMVVVGLACRLSGVLPGWSTLLILGGIIGGGLVAWVILVGDHQRPIVTNRETEQTRIAQIELNGTRFRGERGSSYDGR